MQSNVKKGRINTMLFNSLWKYIIRFLIYNRGVKSSEFDLKK